MSDEARAAEAGDEDLQRATYSEPDPEFERALAEAEGAVEGWVPGPDDMIRLEYDRNDLVGHGIAMAELRQRAWQHALDTFQDHDWAIWLRTPNGATDDETGEEQVDVYLDPLAISLINQLAELNVDFAMGRTPLGGDQVEVEDSDG